MENTYTQEDIDKIKEILKQNYASNFSEPSFYLITTLLIFFAIIYLIHISKKYNPVLIVLLSLVMIRLFIIFHDLCHKSYFPSNERKENKDGFNFTIANFIDVFVVYNATSWKIGHSHHHKVHGNINEFDYTRTLLISSEYEKLPDYQKVLYNFFRFPLVFFSLLPIYLVWIKNIVNFEIIHLIKYCLFMGALYYMGSTKLVVSMLIAQYIAMFIGVILFHLQHQVNIGYWTSFEKEDELSKANAELKGASILQIPEFLKFFTNGIEYHNVHHLDPAVPSYNIRKCYYEIVDKGLIQDNQISYYQSFISLFHTIFNEKTQRYEYYPE